MRAVTAMLSMLIITTSHAVAQQRQLADASAPRADSVAARPTPDAAGGALRPSCSGAWSAGCLETDRQRALLLLGLISGAKRPIALR